MSSTDDLTPILKAWSWQSGQFGVRTLTGHDGRLLIQVRLELGVIQMEADGRPDGIAQGGFGSVLDRVRSQAGGSGTPLSEDDASDLAGEILLFRQRSIAGAVLELWPRVRRDALHNIECLELLWTRSAGAQDRLRFESWRPNEIKMQARAETAIALASGRKADACLAIDRGLEALARAFARSGNTDAFERSIEAQYLRGLRESLTLKLPASQRLELERRMHVAIRQENFELAAILRDELRQLGHAS
ncbi:MAG: UvrB/UvrC motif-containing protein [Planctomycetes bacterium]|nr:UvrB/UvrC motif-containing protein [Planctomycetota bacterium]